MNHWSPSEFDLLETFTRRIKVMSEQQLMSLDPHSPDSNEPRITACSRLIKAELLLTTTVNVPPLSNKEPWLEWQPGDVAPDFEAVWQAVRDAQRRDSVPTRVYWAAPRATNLFGVRGGTLSSLKERYGDLRLSEAYVRQTSQSSGGHWLGASLLNKKLPIASRPEAVIVDANGHWQRLIAIARRGVQPLQEFHAECAAHSFSYQVW